MSNYRVSTKTKTVAADLNNLTKDEKQMITMYLSAGYKLVKQRKGLTFDDMREALKDNAAALKELNDKIAAKENYMKIKKWYETKKSK